MSDTWNQFDYFPSSVYTLNKSEFLDSVEKVAKVYLDNIKKDVELDKIYPIYQSYGFSQEESISDFVSYVAQTSWNILSSQGFDMSSKETFITEMWTHEYYKYGSMDYHSHSAGSQITGFYILKAPKDCSRIIIYDPRPGKIQMNFGSNMRDQIHNSTDIINFEPEPGLLMFTNSWLPHAFSRNRSDQPFTFIHFNIGVRDYYPPPPPAEVI